MKKILLVSTLITLITLGIISLIYWYTSSDEVKKIGSLQTIDLDKSSIDSFDDTCTKESDGQLTCVGNIEQFGCERYRMIEGSIQDLRPYYPMLICENIAVVGSSNAEEAISGVYAIEGSGLMSGRATVVKYVIIRDGQFQFIESAEQLKELFQPIESMQEATAYFQVLHKAVLILDESTLDKLKNSAHGEYLVSMDTLTLSSVSETENGFIITAYSDNTLSCKTELYKYTLLLTRNGDAIEQSTTLVWQSNLECTS